MVHDQIKWRVDTVLNKFDAKAYREAEANGTTVAPYDVHRSTGNMLVYSGADLLWLGLKGGLSATTGLANSHFGSTKSASIAVGDSNTAAANTQTDLQASTGATHRYTKTVDAGYPTHTTGTGASTASKMVFRATFSSSQANFAWQEWAIKNRGGQAAGFGRMLNRAVSSQGTKVNTAIWQFTVTLSLA